VGIGTLVQNIQIVLPALGTIAGSVTDSRGRGLSDAGVTAESDGTKTRQQSAASTDSTGHFVLEGLPPGTYQIHVFADHVRIAGESDERRRFFMRALKDVSTGEKDVKIVLEPAALLHGRVVDADEHGVVGARVIIQVPGREERINALTGADGRFAASVPEGTSLDLEVHPLVADGTPHPRRMDTEPAHAGHLSAVSAGEEEVVVKLPR
jgi:hypothetical protein